MPYLRKLTVPAALVLIIGLAIGAAAALVLRGGVTVTGQSDPCYGLGELVGSQPYTVTKEFAQAADHLGVELTPGEVREARDCRIGEFQVVTIDGATGKGLSVSTDWVGILARATERAKQTPEAVQTFEQSLQESFVTPEVPTDLTAGCDPAWVRTTFEQVQAVMCHPAEWVVNEDNPVSAGVGTDTAQVGVLGLQTESHNTKCASPILVDVRSGTARICAVGPNPFGEIAYGVALPNGRNIGMILADNASSEEKAIALRVAANVESLP